MSHLTSAAEFRPHNAGPAVASKLEAFTKLSTDDRAALSGLTRKFRYVDVIPADAQGKRQPALLQPLFGVR